MNKKLFTLAIVTFSMILAATLENAQAPEPLTIWTDRFEYAPGETGTLYYVFYNDRTIAVTVKKITIVFEGWQAYRNGQWEGNQTIEISPPQAVAGRGIYENSTKFTVPTDGRAMSTWAGITIQTAEAGNIHGDCYITVTSTPRYMDQIITLFTVQVVLIIVCTIIIAATIFLSTHAPQVVWKREEKTE